MPPEVFFDADRLVREGIDAARAGDHTRARDLLSQAVSQDESNVQGWLWLSSEVEGFDDQAFCLRRVLTLDPGNRTAQLRLAWLQEQAVLEEQARWQEEQKGLLKALREALGEQAAPEAAAVEAEEPNLPLGYRTGLIIHNEFALIAALGLVLLALIALGVDGLPAPLPLLQLLLGLTFVLFVPGYALQAGLFPRDDALDGPERLVLSFGLSVAVVPPLALILDRLPWGIRLWPIVIGEGLVIAAFSIVALLRRRCLPAKVRPVLALGLDVKGWWAGQDRTGRVLYGVVAGALLLAMILAAAIILLPKSGEQITEFYVLGPEGLAENYPREAVPGEMQAVTAGIANQEKQAAEYRIEVQVSGETIARAGPVTLQDGEVWETLVTYALPRAGEDQKIEFLLYRDGEREPYRRLLLWLDVLEKPGSGDG